MDLISIFGSISFPSSLTMLSIMLTYFTSIHVYTCSCKKNTKHENEKKRAYEQCILDVEHASFTPLVFSAAGGMAKQSTTFYKRLASLLADKWDHTYTLYRLCCRLSFSLLRSAIQCIRGARSSCGHAIHSSSPIDLVSTEAHFSQQ